MTYKTPTKTPVTILQFFPTAPANEKPGEQPAIATAPEKPQNRPANRRCCLPFPPLGGEGKEDDSDAETKLPA